MAFPSCSGYPYSMTELVLIFLAQILYVSLVTVRWIILVRGARYWASALSFFEILVYAYTLSLVVSKLDEPVRLLVYAAGYAVGCLAGSWLEGRLAYGMAAVQVITPTASNLAQQLRLGGYVVTCWAGQGRDCDRQMSLIVLKRRHLDHLHRLIDRLEPTAVVLEIEPRSLRGGFLPQVPAKQIA